MQEKQRVVNIMYRVQKDTSEKYTYGFIVKHVSLLD